MLQLRWSGGSIGGGGAQGQWDSQGRKGRFDDTQYQLILTILGDWIFDSVFIFLLIALIFYSTVNKIKKTTVTSK